MARQAGPDCPVDAIPRRSSNPVFRQVNVLADSPGVAPPTKLFEANPRRIECWIFNNGTIAIAIGPSNVGFSATTAAPGFIVPGNTAQFIDHLKGELYAVANGATVDVRLADFLDDDDITGQLVAGQVA